MNARTRSAVPSVALALLLVIGRALLSSSPPPASASPVLRYVAPGGACGTASPCYASLQAAVDAAATGDGIKVAAGSYGGVTMRETITQVVFISKTVSIAGGYTAGNWDTPDSAANLTTLDAATLGRVIYITGTITPTLDGLRITGGDARGLQGGSPDGEDVGGGILINLAAATIRNCQIYGNAADDGAGIALGESDAVITGSLIYSNTAGARNGGSGGGVSGYGGQPVLANSLVMTNTAVFSDTNGPEGRGGNGGGAHFLQSSPIIYGSLFRGNVADWGGALSVDSSLGGGLAGSQIISNTAKWSAGGLGVGAWNGAEVSGNAFADNTADTDGGGMWILDSAITVSRNTVVGNRAVNGSAGGIRFDGPAGGTVSGNTVMSNTANWSGAGIFVNGDSLVSDNVVMYNKGNDGAGIQTNGNPILRGNIVSYNEARWHGGGIKVSSGTAWISNTLVTHNTAAWDSGGIRVEGAATLINPVILANGLTSGNDGAGIWMQGAKLTLLHPTIAGNTGSSGASQGIYVKYLSLNSSALTVTNAILANQLTGVQAEAENTAVLDHVLCYNAGGSVCTSGPGNFIVDQVFAGDPRFDLDGYHLMPGSAAIDAGIAAGVTEDTDGQPRTSGAPDLGADEYGIPNGIPLNGGVISPSPGVTVSAPAGAFTGTVVIHFAVQPITFTGSLSNVGVFYDLSATYLSGAPATLQPGRSYSITVSYRQQDVPAGANETDLALYYWSGNAWEAEPTSAVDPLANIISASPNHFSLWGILAPPVWRIYLPMVTRGA